MIIIIIIIGAIQISSVEQSRSSPLTRLHFKICATAQLFL